jgi:hypothetical protein
VIAKVVGLGSSNVGNLKNGYTLGSIAPLPIKKSMGHSFSTLLQINVPYVDRVFG